MSGLRPFFSFYGGKWRTARTLYPPPLYPTIVEPFAGSAGYSLRYAGHRVVLCDRDPIIVGVWRYLCRVTPAEILALPDVSPGVSIDDLHICEEARWLVGFWLNRGAASPCKRPSKWMREHPEYAGSFWGVRVRETIARQVDAIRHWEIREQRWEECEIMGPATWFIDPPYQVAGTHYRHSSRAIDFSALGAWCKTRPGQVIACENAGAEWLPFRPLSDVKTTRRGRRSVEVIWTNDILMDATS